MTFSPDGRTLYASGGEFDRVHAFGFADGYLAKPHDLPVSKEKFVPGGMTISKDGKTLYVAGTWGHGVAVVPVDAPDKTRIVPLGKDSFPYTCLLDPTGQRLLVSLWSKAAVAGASHSHGGQTIPWPARRAPAP